MLAKDCELQFARSGCAASAFHRGVSSARATALMAAKATATAVATTVTAATARRHEHPATRQARYQDCNQGCTEKMFRLHWNAPQG
ncbi:hypothetical protein D3C76_536060 [compost metagenome]